MEMLPALIESILTSPLLLVLIAAVCIIDGFFPPVPSEMTVVAALSAVIATAQSAAQSAAESAAHSAEALAGVAGVTWPLAIVAVAAFGAIAGDSIAFSLGRRVGVERFAWMRRPRVARTTRWISARIHASPATLVLVGRYIPVGRVAVNAMAGASGLRYRRFLAYSTLAGTVWAGMCLAVATLSVAWLGDPLWSALLGMAVMLLIGLGLDAIARRRMRREEIRPATEPDADLSAPSS